MAEQLTPARGLSRGNSGSDGCGHPGAGRCAESPIQSGYRKRRVRCRGRRLHPDLPAMLGNRGGNPGHDPRKREELRPG